MITTIQTETAQGNPLGGLLSTPWEPVATNELASLPAYDIAEIDEMLGGKHFFPRDFAKEYGVREAIVIRFLSWKVRMSQKEEKGKLWHYDPVEALAARYPYIPGSTMHDVLKRLEKAKLIEKGCFNKLSFDRTGWYTVPLRVMDMAEKVPIRFNVLVAKEFGIPHAVLYRNLIYWVARNTSETDPHPYVLMSPTILSRSLPFAISTIKNALGDLVKAERIIKHQDKDAYYALPYLIKLGNIDNDDEGSNPDMGGQNPEMGGSNPDERGLKPDEGGSNPDNNTHYKTINKTIVKAIKKVPFKNAAPPRMSGKTLSETKTDEPTDPSDSEEGEAHDTGDETNGIVVSEASPRKSEDLIDEENQEGNTATSESEQGVAQNTGDGGSRLKYTYEEIMAHNLSKENSFRHLEDFRTGINQVCVPLIKQLDPTEIIRLKEISDPDMLIVELEPSVLKHLKSLSDLSHLKFWMIMNRDEKTPHFAVLETLVAAFDQFDNSNYSEVRPTSKITGFLIDLSKELHDIVFDYNREQKRKAKEQMIQTLLSERDQRIEKYRSVDEDKEDEANLSPAEKARVLRNAINTANKIG